MKPFRWTRHALLSLAEREIDQKQAEAALEAPDEVADAISPRKAYMRRYVDEVLNQPMLLRVIVEETETERVVVTLYRTSQLQKYLKGPKP